VEVPKRSQIASGRAHTAPAAQSRGTGGGGGGTVINISMPMSFHGPVNKDEVGRTAYQNVQAAARQLRAVDKFDNSSVPPAQLNGLAGEPKTLACNNKNWMTVFANIALLGI
jgi:hypothetical protein